MNSPLTDALYGLVALGLCIIVGTVFYLIVKQAIKDARFRGVTVFQICLFAAWSLLIAAVGNDSAKPPEVPHATLRFDTGLSDNGSVATNDYPVIRWTYEAPLAYNTAHIEYRNKTGSNREWAEAGSVPVTDGVWTGFISDCTNREIFVWSDYIPPAPIHTNGVYAIRNITRPMSDLSSTNAPAYTPPRYLSIRTPIKKGDEQISPPELTRPVIFTDEDIDRLLNSSND